LSAPAAPLPSRDHAKGLALAALGGFVLSFDIPLIRLADGGAWTVLALRSGASFLAGLLIWLVWRRLSANAPQLAPGRTGLAVAGLYGLSSVLFILAVFNTSTANLVFILALNSAFAALLSWAWLGERPHPLTLLAMAVMLLAVLLIVGDGVGHGRVLGDLLALLSTFTIACAITVTRASGRDMGLTALSGVLLPLLVALPFAASQGFAVAAPGWILFNGAVVTPLAFLCLASGPRYLSAPEVAMFYLLETVLAPVWVWLVFAETPSRNTAIGGAILVATLLAHSLWQLREGRRQAAVLAARSPG
jgi:drug/metabolite transporter (DMT)-like permease